jgi:O-antigen/teichoic acid export membrane protein
LIIALLAEPITTKWINFEKLDLKTVRLTVLILGLTVAIRWPITPYRGTLMALEKQVQVNLLEVLLRSFRELGSVFILVIISPTIIPFILWQGLIAIIEVISMMVMAWHYQPKTREKAHFQIQILREVWHFAMGMSWNMVVSLLLSRIDIVLLSKLVSLEQFGYYMLASTLSQKLSTIIEPFLASTTPQLVTLISQKNKKEYTNFFYKISLSISLLIIPLASVLIFFASSIMELWTQSLAVATKSSNILAILTFGIMLNCISYVAYEMQIAIGKPQIAAIFNTFSLIFVVPAMILVVPTHHLFGAAIIKASLNIFYFLVNCLTLVEFILPKKLLHWLVIDILFPIIFCFAVCYIISHLYLIFPGKTMAILYIVIGLVINYVSLGCWYRYQRKYFQ